MPKTRSYTKKRRAGNSPSNRKKERNDLRNYFSPVSKQDSAMKVLDNSKDIDLIKGASDIRNSKSDNVKTVSVDVCTKTNLKLMSKTIESSMHSNINLSNTKRGRKPKPKLDDKPVAVDGTMMPFEEAMMQTDPCKRIKKKKNSVREKFNKLIRLEIERKDLEKIERSKKLQTTPIKSQNYSNIEKLLSPPSSPVKILPNFEILKKPRDERMLEYLKSLSGGAYLPNPTVEPYKPFEPYDPVFDEIEKVDSLIELTKDQLIRFVNSKAIENFIQRTIEGEPTCWRAVEFYRINDHTDSLINKSIMDVLETDKNSIVTMEIMRVKT